MRRSSFWTYENRFLKSADPLLHPGIDPNYLGTDADRRTLTDEHG